MLHSCRWYLRQCSRFYSGLSVFSVEQGCRQKLVTKWFNLFLHGIKSKVLSHFSCIYISRNYSHISSASVLKPSIPERKNLKYWGKKSWKKPQEEPQRRDPSSMKHMSRIPKYSLFLKIWAQLAERHLISQLREYGMVVLLCILTPQFGGCLLVAH